MLALSDHLPLGSQPITSTNFKKVINIYSLSYDRF